MDQKNQTEPSLGTRRTLQKSEVLFRQGSPGTKFYVILSGIIELQFDGKMRRILRDGDFFGEIGALAQLPRTATATSLDRSEILEYSAGELDELLKNPKRKQEILSKFQARLLHAKLRHDRKMLQAQDEHFQDFLDPFQEMNLPAGKSLFEQGDMGSQLYFVRTGRLKVIKGDQCVATAQAGDFVGEISALFGVPRTASIEAETDSQLLFCEGSDLLRLLRNFKVFDEFLHELASKRLLQSF